MGVYGVLSAVRLYRGVSASATAVGE
jgi:hypothetical protein